MKKMTYKMFKGLKIFFSFSLILFVAGGLSGATYVLAAANDASQTASTSQATTISVVAQGVDTAITTITFPVGAPSDTISNPYNDIDTVTSSQFLDASASVPVVRLKNNSAGTLNITLEITNWQNGVADSEDYELSDPATTTTASVVSALSTDGLADTVATGATVAAAAYKDLYLELNLSALASVTGTSTLTILGES